AGVFGGAARSQLQVWLLLVPGAVPGIIRQVDQRVSPAAAVIFHRLAHQGRQDVLVADEGGELPWAKPQWGGGFPAGQVRGHRGPAVEDREPVSEGDGLSEGEQVELVEVVADDTVA